MRCNPLKKDLRLICTNFLGGAGIVTYHKDRFFLALRGTNTHPLKGVTGAPDRCNHQSREERWIEVVIDGKNKLDVLTREQDDFTNGLADALAAVFARWYDGQVED